MKKEYQQEEACFTELNKGLRESDEWAKLEREPITVSPRNV